MVAYKHSTKKAWSEITNYFVQHFGRVDFNSIINGISTVQHVVYLERLFLLCAHMLYGVSCIRARSNILLMNMIKLDLCTYTFVFIAFQTSRKLQQMVVMNVIVIFNPGQCCSIPVNGKKLASPWFVFNLIQVEVSGKKGYIEANSPRKSGRDT